jgi:23S rRNA (uracil1939-C5)-methyltransferase
VVQRERPQLIVMDPPRAGVGAEVCALLARISAPEIVYVSCDPVTLARDLKLLTTAGYNLVELHMVDMFPQTFHLETVVVLRR